MKPEERKFAEGILYTDQYQLTMAQLYFRMGLHERPAQFDHFFRSYPDYGAHQAGYCINAGLEWFYDWLYEANFQSQDLDYLRNQKGATGERIFADDFLDWLGKTEILQGLSIHAIPEGRVIHPNEPITMVQGPLAIAQILETSLLNHLNYQILIATKAARIREAGRKRPMLEFGLRRGPERGSNAGARAALIGGADFTSNVGISKVMGLPPKGTHAHSMVQVFLALGESELNAFKAYAEVYPDDCLLLVDTIDTLESGIPNAIKVFEDLRRRGHKPVGIRLDSGDLAYLSIQASKLLDKANFSETRIVLSNQLDELVIWQIITQIEEEARRYGIYPDHVINRLVFGVGTNLITSAGNPALDGVYKLVALRNEGKWVPAIKISENPVKIPQPGQKRVWRIYDQRNKASSDLIGLQDENLVDQKEINLHHPVDLKKFRKLSQDLISEIEPLLVDILLDGKIVYEWPSLETMRSMRDRDLERLDPGVRRIMNPHIYHVSLTQKLWELKQELIKTLD